MSIKKGLRHVEDHIGREIHYSFPPKRIVSLVPSITETLLDLDLADRVVGRTKFCIHPENLVDKIEVVGGTKSIHFDRIEKLNPDLIIANKEENTQEIVTGLESNYPVFITDIQTVDQGINLISDLGELADTTIKATHIVDRITSIRKPIISEMLNVLYLIWQEPIMTIGSDTFIHHMLKEAGFNNIYQDKLRYPEINIEDRIAETDLILLSSEPFPFKEKHAKAFESKYNTKTILVDGELFSWYGSRMMQSWNYFNTIKSTLNG